MTDARDSLPEIPWQGLDPGRPWLPERLVSLYGTPAYDALTPAHKLRLSQIEFVAMAEFGLWLESLFLARFAREAQDLLDADPRAYRDHLQELREEAGHSLIFLELMRRSGIGPLVPAARRPALARVIARHLPSRSTVFWLAMFVGEAVPNAFNRLVLEESALPDAVRAIVAVHMRDENRHVAHARERLVRFLPRLGGPARAFYRPLLKIALRHFVRSCFYPPAAVYAAAGIANPEGMAAAARVSRHRAALVEECAAPVRAFLAEHGLG